jgi:hypothetical protein
LIENAEEKIRLKTTSCKWVESFHYFVASANHEIGLGKGFAYLLETAAAEKLAFRSPTSFSTPRFATFTYTVLKNHLVNFPLIYMKLKESTKKLRKQVSKILKCCTSS